MTAGIVTPEWQESGHNPEIRTRFPAVMLSSPRPLRIVVLVLIFAALVSGTSLLAFRYNLGNGLDELQVTGRHRLDLYAASLEREIDKYAFVPATLELQQDVLQLLASPVRTQELTGQVNRYLEQFNERVGGLSISAWRRARSCWSSFSRSWIGAPSSTREIARPIAS